MLPDGARERPRTRPRAHRACRRGREIPHGAGLRRARRSDRRPVRRGPLGAKPRRQDRASTPGSAPFPSAARRSRRTRQNADRSARRAPGSAASTWEQLPPVGMAGHTFDLDRLAGQRAGNIDRAVGAVGDAVAEMANPIDHQPLNHAPPRRRIRHCHRRRESATASGRRRAILARRETRRCHRRPPHVPPHRARCPS